MICVDDKEMQQNIELMNVFQADQRWKSFVDRKVFSNLMAAFFLWLALVISPHLVH